MKFEESLQEHLGDLTRLAGVLCGERALATDLTADVLLKLWTKWNRIRRLDHPDAYARKAMFRQFIDNKRHVATRTRREFTYVETTPVAGAGFEQNLAEKQLLTNAIKLLPPKQRAALVMKYYFDMPDAAIAESFSCTTSSVRTHPSLALGKLRVNPELVDERNAP